MTCFAFNLLETLQNISPNWPVRFKAKHKKLTFKITILHYLVRSKEDKSKDVRS